MKIELEQHNAMAYLGDDIEVKVTVENTSEKERTLQGFLVLASVYITGIQHKEVVKEGFKVILDPGKCKF